MGLGREVLAFLAIDLAGGWLAPTILGGLILGSLVLEKRYRRADTSAAPDGPGWAQTTETFRDDESGRWVSVWANSATGERRYVETTRND